MAGLSSTFERGDAHDARAILAGALAWWADAGVGEALSDAPRGWLDRTMPVRTPRAAPGPVGSERPAPQPTTPPIAVRVPGSVDHRPSPTMPDGIAAFRDWFATAPLPELPDGVRRLTGEGPTAAATVLVIARPTARESLLDGPHRRLADAMMRAAGLASEAVALIPVVPSHVGPHPAGALADAYRASLFRHLALVGGRALLLGDGPCRTLLGQPAATLRGRWHDVNHGGGTVRVMASFDLDTLLAQPLCKPHAWADLLAFTEDLS